MFTPRITWYLDVSSGPIWNGNRSSFLNVVFLFEYKMSKFQNHANLNAMYQCHNFFKSIIFTPYPRISFLYNNCVCVYSNNKLLWSFANYTNILFNTIRWENLQMTHRVCSATHQEKDGQLGHTCWVWVTRHAGYALSVLHQWHRGYWW